MSRRRVSLSGGVNGTAAGGGSAGVRACRRPPSTWTRSRSALGDAENIAPRLTRRDPMLRATFSRLSTSQTPTTTGSYQLPSIQLTDTPEVMLHVFFR